MTQYATIAEGDTFFADRVDSSVWDGTTSALKDKGLKQATNAFDRLNYWGKMTSASQANQFPRNDDTVTPPDIKSACILEAAALIDGRDPNIEFENISEFKFKYGDVASERDPNSVPHHIAAGIMSIEAWRLIMPFLQDPMALQIRRTS